MKYIINKGNIFNRLTVISDPFYDSNKIRSVYCKCICSTVSKVHVRSLFIGETKSCGCLKRERIIKASTSHGFKSRKNPSSLYAVWTGIKARCYNVNTWNYSNYGGRGIRICREWLNDFETFKNWALASGYSSKLQINRIDNNKDYSPENCNWVSSKVNNRNRRSNNIIIAFNESKCIAEWADDPRCSISDTALRQRIRDDWNAEYAIVAPVNSKKIGIGNV